MDKRLQRRFRQAALIVTLVGLAIMAVGAAMQMFGQSSMATSTGMFVHRFGGWMLFIATVLALIGVRYSKGTSTAAGESSETQGLQPVDVELRDDAASLEALLWLHDSGRYYPRRVCCASPSLSARLQELVSKFPLVGELDARTLAITDQAFEWLGSLENVALLRLSSEAADTLRLRSLQVALPACRVLIDDGIPVDQYQSRQAIQVMLRV